jgi:hypothetical protein
MALVSRLDESPPLDSVDRFTDINPVLTFILGFGGQCRSDALLLLPSGHVGHREDFCRKTCDMLMGSLNGIPATPFAGRSPRLASSRLDSRLYIWTDVCAVNYPEKAGCCSNESSFSFF